MKEFLLNIDRRIIFVFVALGVIIPALTSFNLPINPTPNVQSIYDTIEEVGAKNGTILISFDYGPGSFPEVQPHGSCSFAPLLQAQRQSSGHVPFPPGGGSGTTSLRYSLKGIGC